MTISAKTWERYIGLLRKTSDIATEKMRKYLERTDWDADRDSRLEAAAYALSLAQEYGSAASAVASQMYDEILELSKPKNMPPPAQPAPTATYAETRKAIDGAAKFSKNNEYIASVVGRLVKQAGADTMLQNAARDGAEFAWIPHGDTCAFCLALASRGWQRMSKDALNGGHAEHIHSNCDCTYAVRFNEKTYVEGYEPGKYRGMYEDADPGGSPKDKINAMRRDFYAENKDRINAQKRAAYAKRRDLNSSAAEEFDVND